MIRRVGIRWGPNYDVGLRSNRIFCVVGRLRECGRCLAPSRVSGGLRDGLKFCVGSFVVDESAKCAACVMPSPCKHNSPSCSRNCVFMLCFVVGISQRYVVNGVCV